MLAVLSGFAPLAFGRPKPLQGSSVLCFVYMLDSIHCRSLLGIPLGELPVTEVLSLSEAMYQQETLTNLTLFSLLEQLSGGYQ